MTPDRRLKSIVASAASTMVRANSRHGGEIYALEQRLAKRRATELEKLEQRHEQRVTEILGPLTEPMRAAVLAMVEVLETQLVASDTPDAEDPVSEEAAE